MSKTAAPPQRTAGQFPGPPPMPSSKSRFSHFYSCTPRPLPPVFLSTRHSLFSVRPPSPMHATRPVTLACR
ncbi:hypothetical protein BBK36DRAFT_135710 [Trichoderma citrinoviride]|uniref:Uncharacterized protein n=1 Tax=Trichoderma citrinoviride TaxID=58853 RepID=A0A2T4B7B8_9HYPO|nr:hypothetical protein BBK36DRAFT_135710 [Trichoderma citrinoviride]PTB65217.1 hypothetical protein BBK36DRAFT_135710 [Trichoderma citrinoviride]